MKKNWYVVYTKSRCEKKVAALLSKRGIENYCPLNKVVKKWADRRKIVHEPLFTSYVFVRPEEEELYKVKQVTSDIVNFVYWLGRPAIVRDDEITSIQLFLDNYSNVKVEKKEVHVDDRVRIISGPLMNREGSVTSVENNKVRLSLPSLGYLLIAETKLSNVEVIRPAAYKAEKMIL